MTALPLGYAALSIIHCSPGHVNAPRKVYNYTACNVMPLRCRSKSSVIYTIDVYYQIILTSSIETTILHGFACTRVRVRVRVRIRTRPRFPPTPPSIVGCTPSSAICTMAPLGIYNVQIHGYTCKWECACRCVNCVCYRHPLMSRDAETCP